MHGRVSELRSALAISHYEQARQLFARHGTQFPAATTAPLFAQLGQAYEHLNHFKAAQTTYQTMLETARKLHDPAMECAALNRLAVLHSEDFSQLEQVMALLQDALSGAKRHHDQEGLAETQWSLARVYYYVLDLDASLVHGKQAYALACGLGRQDLTTKSLNILAYTTRALGQWEEAEAIADQVHLEGLEVSKRVPSPRYIGLSLSLVCVDSALADDWDAASNYAQQMLATRGPRVVVCPEVPHWPETEALLRAGLGEQASEMFAAFHEHFKTNRRCHLDFVRVQAVLAESQGEYEHASGCLQEAIAEAKALGLPGELWQAEAALARLYLHLGEEEQAALAFTRARVVLEKLAKDITSGELQSRFLASPQVQQILLHGETTI